MCVILCPDLILPLLQANAIQRMELYEVTLHKARQPTSPLVYKHFQLSHLLEAERAQLSPGSSPSSSTHLSVHHRLLKYSRWFISFRHPLSSTPSSTKRTNSMRSHRTHVMPVVSHKPCPHTALSMLMMRCVVRTGSDLFGCSRCKQIAGRHVKLLSRCWSPAFCIINPC